VAVSGNTVVVGAPYDDTGATDSGSAYVFDAATGNLLATLNNPTPASQDIFGPSVAFSGGRFVVGAPYEDGIAADRGAAYIFVDDEPYASFTANPNPVSPSQAITFDASASYNSDPQRGLRPQPNKTRGSLAEVAETAEKSK
jgi:hypothetical protein